MDRPRDLFLRCDGGIVVDAGISIDLQVDPRGRHKLSGGRGANRMVNVLNEIGKRNFDMVAGRDIDTGTFHKPSGLFTGYEQPHASNTMIAYAEILVEKDGTRCRLY